MNGTNFYDLSHMIISNVTHIPLTTNIRRCLWESRERESHSSWRKKNYEAFPHAIHSTGNTELHIICVRLQ